MSLLNEISIQYIKGVGPAKKKLFEHLGIQTVDDIFNFFPRRYEDRRVITAIAQVQLGQTHTIIGKVKKKQSRKSWHTKKHVTEISVDDGGGRIYCTWFNQPYLEKYFREDQTVVCYGKVDMYKNRLQMVSPEYEILQDKEEESLSLKRIVPIYPLTRGMTQRFIRRIVRECLDKYQDQLVDELPVKLRNKHRLANIKRSIANIHFPEDFTDYDQALKRVSFEEFFFFQISVILRRLSIVQKKGVAHAFSDADALKFVEGFPFELTKAQKSVIRDITGDMRKSSPMLRLVQGDVGSGKTLVALFGCVMAFYHKSQSAFMAPTEILARQHYENILKFIENGSLPKMNVAFLSSNLKSSEKNALYDDLSSGRIDLVVGTHALLTEVVDFKCLSFVVVDEQHKFGVRQRALLTEKGHNPDVLVMTATPIPRTLCLTLYGDLDVSVIDQMPKGRGSIQTVHNTQEEVDVVYGKVREELKKGRQAYIVYPIIEESETLDLKAAQDMFKQFKTQEFKDFKVGIVHGQLKREQTEKIMNDFKTGKIDVLVATTVLEVGVDVPNASVMVIEHAERFGLAQLHQLRGRIGRGVHDSFCYLIADPTTEDGQRRIDALVATTDGFKIAEEDLQIRGPGKYFGRHQHGLNELKVANPATQIEILELARDEAFALTKDDPFLNKKQNKNIRSVIGRRYPTYLNMVTAG